MDVDKLTTSVYVNDGGYVTLRVSGLRRGPAGIGDSGMHVDIPFVQEDLDAPPLQRATILSADLTHAFKVLVYLYDHPEEAAEEGTLTDPEDVAHIRAWHKE